MKSLTIVSCLLIVLTLSAPCMAQIDTIKLVKHVFPKYDGNERHSYFPYDAIRLTMLTPATIRACNGTGTASPETAIGPYKKKKMYGSNFMFNGRLFLVSKKEYNTLSSLVQLINSRSVMVSLPGSTPYADEYVEKGAYYVSTNANGITSFYVLSDKDSATNYINKFIEAVEATDLSSTTKVGVIDICKTSLSLMDIN